MVADPLGLLGIVLLGLMGTALVCVVVFNGFDPKPMQDEEVIYRERCYLTHGFGLVRFGGTMLRGCVLVTNKRLYVKLITTVIYQYTDIGSAVVKSGLLAKTVRIENKFRTSDFNIYSSKPEILANLISKRLR